MRIFATRHGKVQPKSYYNDDASRPVGDSELSLLGEEQARLLGKRLKALNFNGVIFSSPYDRTLKTADIVAEELNTTFTALPCLREIFVESTPDNLFKGMTAEEITQRYPRANIPTDFPYPWWEEKTEELIDVLLRMEKGLEPVLFGLQGDIDVLLVGHAASVVAMRHLFNCNAIKGFHWNCHLSLLYATEEETYAFDSSFLPEDCRTGNALLYAENRQNFEAAISQIHTACQQNSGTRVLHIGDTHTSDYAYIRALIKEIKPDVIVHTGDFADELKAGRIAQAKQYWKNNVPQMVDMLRASGARIIAVAGNNDLEGELKTLAPDFEIVARNTVFEIDGKKVLFCHELNRMDESIPADVYLYGHGKTGETRTETDNERNGKRFFNAVWGASFHILEKDVHIILPIIHL